MKNVVLFLFCLALLSCVRHEKPNLEDRYQVIQSKIDQKEYDQAESELVSILEKDPQNERARMILASVSVHRAGITLKDYFLLESLSHLEDDPSIEVLKLNELEKLKLPTDTGSQKALEFLKQISHVAGRAVEISNKFEQVTLVSEDGANQLYQALNEMEKIKTPQSGNALYRGVIKLFYFKYLWENGKFLKFGNRQFCLEKINSLSVRLEGFHRFTLGMVRDVSQGFPKSQSEFETQIQNLDRGFLDARKFLVQVKDATRNFQETLQDTLLKDQLDGWKCEF
ncbi:MAG: hypothetical protein ACAH59_02760 [Pseudobdellovibrionaceae bacterium]